jgi:hypothetical protein
LPRRSEAETDTINRIVEADRKEYLNRKKEKTREIDRKKSVKQKRLVRVEATKMIWEKEILPNWDTMKKSKKVRELWVDGIPQSIRGRAWALSCGN